MVDDSKAMNGSKDHSLKNDSSTMDITETMEIDESRPKSMGESLNTISLTMPSIADEFPQDLSTAEEENFMSHLDSNSEVISKGYCSDNEVLLRKKEQLENKLQKCGGRSRSGSKKGDKSTGKTTPKANKI